MKKHWSLSSPNTLLEKLRRSEIIVAPRVSVGYKRAKHFPSEQGGWFGMQIRIEADHHAAELLAVVLGAEFQTRNLPRLSNSGVVYGFRPVLADRLLMLNELF